MAYNRAKLQTRHAAIIIILGEASILISVICMIDSWGEDCIIQKTPSKLVFLPNFNIVLGLLDELVELQESIKHFISIQIS